MSKVTLPSEPEDERLFAQEFREADTCKVEQGMQYDPRSLTAQRWLEATVESPATLFDEPVPWRFWKAVAHRIRTTSTHWTPPELREARDVAHAYCKSFVKNRVNAMTPFRAQMDLHDLLVGSIPAETPLPMLLKIRGRFDEALRSFREAVYIEFNAKYLDRQVG
jgi:hypothetical protein